MKKIIYVSPTGLLEPLGQSQILSYLKHTSSSYRFNVISFEKESDLKNIDEIKRINEFCDNYNIEWTRMTFHSKYRKFNKIYELTCLLCNLLYLSVKEKPALLHCRSYLPTFLSLIVGKFLKVPVVFDMRALLPEELVLSGRIKRNGVFFKLMKKLERYCLANSAHIISLTRAAIPHLKKEVPSLGDDKFSVIPTCVELDSFYSSPRSRSGTISVGSVGSLNSGWFPKDWLFDIYREFFVRDSHTELRIISKDNIDEYLSNRSDDADFKENILLKSVSHNDVCNEINFMSFGVVYNHNSVGRLGSFPTRMAEFLACGIPVMCNAGLEDIEYIINKYNVGVIVKPSKLSGAVTEMQSLLNDPQISRRCQLAAKEYFSSENGAKKHLNIYSNLVS